MYFPAVASIVLSAVISAAAAHASSHHPHDATAHDAGDHQLRVITANDNRRPAGTLADGVLTLELRAGLGLWRPEGDAGPALRVEALGEGSFPFSAPAPLIRVTEGTAIAVSIRNELGSPMRVHGLCERGGAACVPIDVPAGDTRQVRFTSGPAGTYAVLGFDLGHAASVPRHR